VKVRRGPPGMHAPVADTKTRRELIARKPGGERPCLTVAHVAALASSTDEVEVDARAASSAAG
jgi:hypothetical protein